MKPVVYHPKVPGEARALLHHYEAISPRLADLFWDELLSVIEQIRIHPTRHHFDRTGLKRSNLRRFPVHILFRVLQYQIRIIVICHDRRDPAFGSQRK